MIPLMVLGAGLYQYVVTVWAVILGQDLIMDNGSSHTSRATRAWHAAHPRITVTCSPKHPSWLNMIEQWFGVLTRKLLRRGDFTPFPSFVWPGQ